MSDALPDRPVRQIAVPQSDWYSQIKDSVPSGDVVKHAVREVEELPGLDKWVPPHGLVNAWHELVMWGIVLGVTKPLSAVNKHREQIAAEILASNRPRPETWAELSAAALCLVLGATKGERLRPDAMKTADWRLEWPGGQLVDVEVTAATQKGLHLRRAEGASALSQQVSDPSKTEDLVIHIVDPDVAADREGVVAASTISNGAVLEHPGRWQVRAQAIDRIAGEAADIVHNDPAPPWWPEDCAKGWIVTGMFPAPGDVVPAPQVRMCFGIPFRAYINSVERKASAPQGKKGMPFLLAVDVARLPGAFKEMPRAIEGYLSQWTSVSGILLYRDMVSATNAGWRWLLVPNPHATIPLPGLTDHKAVEIETTYSLVAGGDTTEAP